MSESEESQRFLAGELSARLLSAIVLIVIALSAAWIGGMIFVLFCAAGGAWMIHEFSQICGFSQRRRVVLFVFFALMACAWFAISPSAAAFFALCATGGLIAFAAVERSAIWLAAAFLYAAIPFLSLCLLRGANAPGYEMIVVLFAAVWGADTVAYFTGRAIGGPRLAPRISPNKTWAGFAGALAGAVLAGMLIALLLGHQANWRFLLFCLLLGLAAVMGDLAESWLKRRFLAKDAGRLIPGHGGLLDRIDGLIFAAFFAWLTATALGAAPFVPGDSSQVLARTFILQ